MRIHCMGCGKLVSTEVPDETIVRAVAYCPECIVAGKVLFPEETSEPVRDPFCEVHHYHLADGRCSCGGEE